MEEQRTLEKGTHFHNRAALLEALRHWLETTDDETIGDTTRFAGTPWVSFESSLGIVNINADTTRNAVARMLDYRKANSVQWSVIENSRGKVNKVIFSASDSHQGWYAYLRTPVDQPTSLGDR